MQQKEIPPLLPVADGMQLHDSSPPTVICRCSYVPEIERGKVRLDVP